MKIALGADHAGAALKNELIETVRSLGHEPIDFGGDGSDKADDYPDYAEKVGNAVQTGAADRGILVCGSGVGVSVAANKIPGVRAAIAHDTYSAHQGVEHDDMNVLVLGERVIGPALAQEVTRAFLDAKFTAEARHVRRLNKVKAIEAKYSSEETK